MPIYEGRAPALERIHEHHEGQSRGGEDREDHGFTIWRSSAPAGSPLYLDPTCLCAVSETESRAKTGPLGWMLAVVGGLGAVGAAVLSSTQAREAATQDWPPFVLVTGLLLVGLVADQDGLFSAAGRALAGLSPSGVVLYGGAMILVVSVTTLLNLDTSVAFLTPVLVYCARSRGEDEAPLLYGCLLLSNAGSLLLPGSNLTNLIVLGHLHLSGGEFFRHMAPAAIAAALVTAVVVGAAEHRSLHNTVSSVSGRKRPVFGVGLIAVVGVTVLVLVFRSPAVPVAAVGVIAVSVRSFSGNLSPRRALRVLGLPVLVGLFGVAVALGTLGRVVGTSESAVAPQLLGYCGRRGLRQCVREQSPRCLAVGSSSAASTVRPPGRAEHRPKSVRHRFARLAPLAPDGEVRRCSTVPQKSKPSRSRCGAPLDGRRLGNAGTQRVALSFRAISIGIRAGDWECHHGASEHPRPGDTE